MKKLITLVGLMSACSQATDRDPIVYEPLVRFDARVEGARDAGTLSIPPPMVEPSPYEVVINEVSASGEDPVELLNVGAAALDLSGWRVADSDDDPEGALLDHRYVFPAGSSLAPGERVVLLKETDHPFGIGAVDSISLYDEHLRLVDYVTWAEGEALVSFCRLPDGVGEPQPCESESFGFENGGEAPPPADAGVPDAATPSDGGSTDVRPLPPEARVVINEASATGDDEIELYNAGDGSADLTGWGVSDADYDPGDADTADHLYVLPEGSRLEPGGFLALVRGADHTFGLGAEDSVTLWDADGQVVDVLSWVDGAADPSWCRRPDGAEAASACDPKTPGESNDG